MNKEHLVGTLADFQIKEYCQEGKLICENYDENNVKQACYELRASNIYHDLSDGNKKYNLKNDEYILIKPKQLVVVITREVLDLPKDILGRILMKGSLFSIGLIPVNTYADPGFVGQLGLVINNVSNDYIKINIDENIAKIEFCKLQYEVEKDYKGQHGYSTQEWIVKGTNILTDNEIKNDVRIKDEFDDIEKSYGEFMAGAIKRVFSYQKKLNILFVIYSIFVMVIVAYITCMASNDRQLILSTILSVFTGVVASVIFTIITSIATKVKYKRRK